MRFLMIVGLAVSLWSCTNNVAYNSFQDLEDGNWLYDSTTVFNFSVDNASSPYDLNYNVRYNLDYPYYNLYVKYELMDDQGKLLRASMQEANLMHPDTGVPLGSGESIFDSQLSLLDDYKFPTEGKYQFKIRQYMRVDTLPGILAVGVTLENPSE